MNCMQSLKAQTGERVEQSERNLTRALDRAHRELDRFRAQAASIGECVA